MVLKRSSIIDRLKRFDETLHELHRYEATTFEEFRDSISLQWIIEHGLIRCATIIFDIADHLLSGHFNSYSESYEESLAELYRHGVISEGLFQNLKGLGGFRNVLVHQYMVVEPGETLENFRKGLKVFPQFGQEIQSWLAALDE